MVTAETVASAVADCVGRAATALRPDVRDAMRAALARETSERGRWAIEQLLANAELAERDGMPLCQDTGTVWVLLELGAEERLGGDPQALVDSAIAETYRRLGLRMSLCRDALLDRSNTGDNTPAFLEVVPRPGTGARVSVMLKGGGSDNASSVTMLAPAEGWDGVVSFVVDAVRAKAAAACPPLLLGVGAGATFDKVGSLAKRALLRRIGSTGVSEQHALLEARLLEAVNATGVGAGGFGGVNTALAVHLLTAPCHIASLPVAVNMGCSAVRSAHAEIE